MGQEWVKHKAPFCISRVRLYHLLTPCPDPYVLSYNTLTTQAAGGRRQPGDAATAAAAAGPKQGQKGDALAAGAKRPPRKLPKASNASALAARERPGPSAAPRM
jgi:hypothetical protein